MKHEAPNHDYDVIIIGAGASGASLLYTLAQFTNIPRIAIIEKYKEAGSVNSKSSNNSQTLHVGDIETNYSIEKAKAVQEAASMLVHYAHTLSPKEAKSFLFPMQKMVLGVGDTEVALLEKRYQELLPIFPTLKKLYRQEIAEIEPNVIKGRKEDENVIALYNQGHAVDYQELAKSFITHANREGVVTMFETPVTRIEKIINGYKVHTTHSTITASVVVVNADSYSLYFAKQLGYGEEFSLIPVAGSFFFTHTILKGKVYTIQNPNLPFAAIHGDPDISVHNETRWGPTARIFPVLESRNLSTVVDYFISARLFRYKTVKSFIRILSDTEKFIYLLKNGLYEIPFLGTWLFLQAVKKIAPSVTYTNLRKAKGFGGMRLQRVDTKTGELKLGEGKIIGDHIVFNMTPSPGASVSLYNALRDAEIVTSFFDGVYTFEKDEMQKKFSCDKVKVETVSTSIPSTYVA